MSLKEDVKKLGEKYPYDDFKKYWIEIDDVLDLIDKHQPSDLIKEVKELQKHSILMAETADGFDTEITVSLYKVLNLIQNSGWISPQTLADEIEKVHAQYLAGKQGDRNEANIFQGA